MTKLYFNHKHVACFAALILWSWNVASVSSNLVETVLNIQYDDEFVFCPEVAENAASAPAFPGGDDFFNSYFSELTTKVQQHSATLKALDITKRGRAPSISSMNDIYVDLMDNNDYNQIQKVVILLGENLDVVYCYEEGIQVNCEDAHKLLYKTSATTWTYAYECRKWQANYVDTAVRYRPDTNVTKVLFYLDMDIQHIDVNQCPDSQDVTFADTALCMADISMCEYINGSGFVIGSYECRCTECSNCGTINGTILSDPENNATNLLESHCTPPPPPPAPAPVVVLEPSLRYGLIALNAFCIILCVVFAVVSLVLHSSQAIKSANLSVLELILFGAVYKYAMLILILWPPSQLLCYIIPWLAEISFVSMFAAIVVKIYKSIAMRKTKSLVSDALILKPWVVAALVTVVYMASWTASSLTYSAMYNTGLVSTAGGDVGQPQCLSTAWNYVTQAAEVLFVCYGLGLCFIACKLSVSAAFGEIKWYTAVLMIELILSVSYYLLWPSLGLEGFSLIIATTIYQHLTVTVGVLLIFCPKFHYARVGSKSADISDSGWIGADGEFGADANGVDKMKLNEADSEIETLKARLRKYEDVNEQPLSMNIPGTPQASPRPSKTKAVNGDEHELEPLNPTVKKSNSSNKLSF